MSASLVILLVNGQQETWGEQTTGAWIPACPGMMDILEAGVSISRIGAWQSSWDFGGQRSGLGGAS